jgi:serine/threonine-protein kinase
LTRELTALVGEGEPVLALAPAVLGRYLIECEIGHGAMGVVYRAVDPLLERPVALKVMRLPFAMSVDDRHLAEQRFLREASLAASISHPNTVVVHDFGRDEETDAPFIAFELLQGRALTDVVASGRLDWREALRITSRLADALHHAHQAGVVHRDIKPGNVMLLESGRPKILDFGIARAAAAQLTGIGDTWGTPAYMSPEQVTGAAVDSRTDLFSLGSLCFELVTGRQAFRGDTIPQIVARLAFGETPLPSSMDPALPRDVDVMIARALAKDPAERYPDGAAFAEDIADVLDGRPLRERPGLASPDDDLGSTATAPVAPTLPPRAISPRRTRLATALAAAGLVASVALMMALPNVAGPVDRPAAPLADAVPIAAAASAPAPLPEPVAAAVVARPSRAARVALSVEHGFSRGRIRVFVDDALALDRRLTGRPTRHLLVLKRQAGSMGEVLEVPPGDRLLRFEVDGDGTRRTGRVRRSFAADETRLLRLKAGKRLDLEWQS